MMGLKIRFIPFTILIVTLHAVTLQSFTYLASQAHSHPLDLSVKALLSPTLHTPCNVCSQVAKRNLPDYQLETIDLPGNTYRAHIRTTTLYLPVTAACAALESFYTHIIGTIHHWNPGDITLIMGTGHNPTFLYRMGDLRFVVQSQIEDRLLGWEDALEALLSILLERVRLGMPVAWEGILLRPEHIGNPEDDVALITLALGDADMWRGWPRIQQ